MEDSLLRRLKLRRDRLATALVGIEEVFATGLDLSAVPNHIIELKSLIEKTDNETNQYLSISNAPDKETVDDCVDKQLKAEEHLLTLQKYNTGATESTKSATKLPKLGLPSFNGDQLKWSQFWDRFEASVGSQSMAGAEKLGYLVSCLEGPAQEAIAGLPINNVNYLIAVQTLKERFGINQITIDAHYSALTKLPKAQGTSLSCRLTLDKIEQHLRILESLGEPANGNYLRSLVLGKFPESVIHEVHIMCKDNEISVPRIRDYLSSVITAMERSALLSSVATEERPEIITTEALLVPVAKSNDDRPLREGAKRHNKRKGGSQSDAPTAKKMRWPCLFCKMSNHYSAQCKKVKTAEARKKKLEGRCLRCLRKNHPTEQCKKKQPCFNCKGDHLQMLCPKLTGSGELEFDHNNTKILKNKCTRECTFLQTAVVEASSPNNDTKWRRSRILLDSGSQRSYITAKSAKSLNLLTEKEDLLQIFTFGASEPQEISSPSAKVIIKTKRGISKSVQVNIVPRIAEKIPIATFDYEVDIPADDETAGEGIDILLGNDYYCAFTRENKIQVSPNIYLLDTDFGWVLSGSTIEEKSNVLSVITYCRCHESGCPYFTQPDLPLRHIDVQFLWSLESIGITDSPKATRQEEAVRHFNETVQFRDGRYEVKWPWVDQDPDLPTNFGLAYGRLKGLVKRLDEESLVEYNKILQEQKDAGVIEECRPIQSSEQGHLIHYLPHHMVKQSGKKGRIVYDASAKTAGKKSLNECLYSGPSMLEDLTGLILRCRASRIGIMADVERAFLQVGLQTEDRDVTRFLWLKNPQMEPTADNLIHYRFRRLPFGVISSPFLLTATIRHHLSQSDERLLKIIGDRCYVDNLVTGANSTEHAREIYRETRKAFDQVSMNIRDWVSNDKELLDSIPEQHKAKDTDQTKMLGLIWDLRKDTLKLNVTENHFTSEAPEPTRREVLRLLARIYDPCGFVSPFVLPMKLLFQRVCQNKLKWDEKLSDDLSKALEMVLHQLRQVTEVELPRYVGAANPNLDTSHELHCFSDASKEAYAAVVYLTTQNADGRTVSFVMGKSRVSRIEDKNEPKIPRLELLGFLIGSRLLTYVETNLELQIQKKYLWTDSQVVLSWMRSDKLLPPFVANRVNDIKRNHPHTEMLYVNTKSNPADVATRQETGQHRIELWLNGPEFLKRNQSEWPENRCTLFSVEEVLDEANPGDIVMEVLETPAEPVKDISMETVDEDTIRIRQLQSQYFPEEVRGKETHLAKNLDLYLDVDGILRCGGRMTNTTWNYDMKHPILLPRDCEFTNEIIKKTHVDNLHVGAAHTLSLIRKLYWIPQGKSQVQKYIRKCPQCTRHGGGPYKLPKTPALPSERVNYSSPFSYTGLDYFGPLYTNTATGKEKRWVALFTCLAIRAIHLEVVNNLSAEECLLAMRRFIATHGTPERVYSDNATYFKLTAEVMSKPFCTDKQIQWKFIPQLAPWHGGFYERLVALVKHCLKRTVEKRLLKDSELHTILKESQAVVNTRPLCSVETEVIHILRPSDFISLGKCFTTEPATTENRCEGSLTKTDLIAGWKKGLKAIQDFKQMFIGQYLISLRERYQHSPKQPRIRSDREPRIGDIVQIKSDSKNRLNWKVGRISELIRGADGECRVAKVAVDKTILTRSIGHLYPLEMDDDQLAPSPQRATENEKQLTNQHVTEPPVLFIDNWQDLGLVDGADLTDAPQTPVTRDQTEVASHSDKTITSPDPTTEIETTDPIVSETQDTNQEEFHSDTPPEQEMIEVPETSHSDEVRTRSRRQAAMRAREKIRECSRLLLALLK